MDPRDEYKNGHIASAVNDFRRARQKAAMESLMGVITGRSTELLPYEEVRKHLRPIESANRQLKDIPLSAIVGSVNRYADFSRSFLPRQESDVNRWARVRVGVDTMRGLDPIDVYQVGEVYFVLDGHHRVSVARQLGAEKIQAYVTKVYTRVPLSPGDQPDDLIIKAEYTDFLAQTHIDDLHPGANLLITAPGQYTRLLEQISSHQYQMEVEHKREIPYAEAVTNWYDQIYQPVVRLIQERNLLRDFPGRTETDLYLFIMEHRSSLGGHELGWEASPETTVAYIQHRFGESFRRRFPRLLHRVQDWLIPDPLEPGPPSGSWRREHFSNPHRMDHLFDDLLVTVPVKRGWSAVDLAMEFARREEARLTGLHVLGTGETAESEKVKQLQDEFSRRCENAGVAGRMVFETGEVARLLYERSSWMDLLIFRMDYPPPTQPLARLRSGARLLIHRSYSPLLAVPETPVRLNSAMLAYGGGLRSDEALFLATYLAGSWKLPLTVITVKPRRQTSDNPSPIHRARKYLEEHNIEANYIEESGDPARVVSFSAEECSCDLIIMGAYEGNLIKEAVVGSTLDSVLRTIHRPVLICS